MSLKDFGSKLNFFYNKRKLILFFIDFGIMAVSSLLAFFISDIVFGVTVPMRNVYVSVLILIACCLAGLFCTNTYRNIWRYATAADYFLMILGIVLGAMIYYILEAVFSLRNSSIITVLTVFASLLGMIISRLAYHTFYRYIKSRDTTIKKEKTLIVGAGDAGSRLVNEMKNGESSPYLPVAFADDDPDKIGRKINGVTIVGACSDIPNIVESMEIKNIVIAMPAVDAEKRKRILNICSETICEVRNIPYIHELVMDSNLLGQARKINIEDLLGRDVIEFDCKNIKNMISGSVCMVTGGGGSIGSELCRQIASYGPGKLVIVDIYENNAYNIQQELIMKYANSLDMEVHIASVRDKAKMDKIFSEVRPEIVFHAAAHKHVPLMENDPEEAIKNNIFGTFNCAELAKKYKARKFVLVSTDKAVNPTNVMGATKRCCEMIVQYFAQEHSGTEYVAVRFGNVLGSNGSVIPLFEKQISEGGPVTVTHPDIIRYFMTIPEAVSLILQAGAMARGGEIFVLNMGEPVKILSLAENLIKLHGKEPYIDIDIKFSGLRPGEKLFEELLMDEEGLKNTANKKIFIGQQIEIEPDEFLSQLRDIKRCAEANDSAGVVEKLRDIVPTFNHVVINQNV